MKKYVKNNFGRYGGVIVLVVFFVLLISLSVGGALYVFMATNGLVETKLM